MTYNVQWKWITCWGVALLFPLLSLQSQTQARQPEASPDSHVAMPLDTTLLPGRQDFTDYRTPGLCLSAAGATERVARRGVFDTTSYAPERETLSHAAVMVAQRCGARFNVTNVFGANLLDLMRLALMSGDDSEAHAAAVRYVASQPDSMRRWALYAVDTTYLHVRPMRSKAAEAITAALDSLGTSAALQRFAAYKALEADARLHFDTSRLRQFALAGLSAYAQMSAYDTKDMDAGGTTNLVADLFFLQLYQTPVGALERTKQLVQATGYQHWDWFQVATRVLQIDWALQQVGRPVPQLHADYWFARDSSHNMWPIPGTVSIYILGSEDNIEFSTLAMWRRLLERYGDSIDVTVMTNTQGYYNDGPPLTTAQEAARRARYYHDELHLPVTVVVDTTPVRQLPDGRRFHGKAAFTSDPYYRCSFIMTDTAGKILLALPSSVPDEAWLNAWISKALEH